MKKKAFSVEVKEKMGKVKVYFEAYSDLKIETGSGTKKLAKGKKKSVYLDDLKRVKAGKTKFTFETLIVSKRAKLTEKEPVKEPVKEVEQEPESRAVKGWVQADMSDKKKLKFLKLLGVKNAEQKVKESKGSSKDKYDKINEDLENQFKKSQTINRCMKR